MSPPSLGNEDIPEDANAGDGTGQNRGRQGGREDEACSRVCVFLRDYYKAEVGNRDPKGYDNG